MAAACARLPSGTSAGRMYDGSEHWVCLRLCGEGLGSVGPFATVQLCYGLDLGEALNGISLDGSSGEAFAKRADPETPCSDEFHGACECGVRLRGLYLMDVSV
eukprot:6178114-Pleurochrysis_carterae.AAC.4